MLHLLFHSAYFTASVIDIIKHSFEQPDNTIEHTVHQMTPMCAKPYGLEKPAGPTVLCSRMNPLTDKQHSTTIVDNH